MTSLLRSCKFVRFLAGITRNISYGNGRQDNLNVAGNHNPNAYRGLAIRALATQQRMSVRQENNNLDKSLKKIDQEARRAGRISKRELDEILEEIKQTRSATSSQSLMVIRFCGSLVPEEHPEVRTKLVQDIWNTLESLGVPMDISHYNALLRVYWENGHQFSPTEFLKQLERKGVEPNRVTYQRLVAQYCQKGEMDGAATILQIMRDKQMPVNETVFNALVNGHSQNGDMESARGILTLMKQAGLEATADTYTALLCGHAKQGDIEAIRAVLAEAESQNIEFMNKDILEVVYSLAQAGHQEHVDEILDFKKSAGFVQECINTILRLVNIGQEDVGKKLLYMIPHHVRQGPDGPETLPSGTFFVKQLVKAGRPTDKIISICEELQKSGANPRALYVALETSLNEGNDSISYELMQKLKEAGEPLRQHYFWPLFLRKQRENNVKGLCEVILAMQKLDVPIKGDTLREYVLDSIKGDSLGKINLLRSCGVSVGTAAVSVIINLLEEGKLEEAANLAGQVKAQYPFEHLKRFLGKAFGQSKNAEALVKMLQCVAGSKKDEDDSGRIDGQVGELLVDSISNLKDSKGETSLQILKGLVDCGLSINVASAEKLQDILGSELTAEISESLTKLTSGSLELQPLQISELNSNVRLPTKSLETMYESMKARNQPTRIIRKNLLLRYCRSGNLEKAEEIKKSLDAENFVHSVGSLALLMDLYANQGKLEEALSMKKLIAERDPDVKLDNIKLVRLATAQIKLGKFDDGLVTLKETYETELDSKTLFNLRGACWELLNHLAELKEEEKLKIALDSIIGNKVVPINNVLLGPLVKVKLLQDDIPGALEQFQRCCEQHRATPWKSELTRRLIDIEDAASLQKLTDLSTQVHGEVNSLYDLVFAFVECGRIRQARRILETPGLRARTFRMESACERYCESGKLSSLEGLLEATKELHHVDRSHIFLNLLKLFCKNDETDKALNLWTQAQEENVLLTDEFLIMLSKQLKKHNMEIPFTVPEVAVAETPQRTEKVDAAKPAPPAPARQPRKEKVLVAVSKVESDFMELRQALRRNDVDGALEIRTRLAANGLAVNVRDSSFLIENLINADRVGEAFKIAKEMIQSNVFPLSRVFRYLLNKVAATGDVDGIAELGYHMDDEQKKVISYDNRLCNAYLFSNRAKDYLELLEQKIKNAKGEAEISKLAEQFPRGSALGILSKHPELTEQLSNIARHYAENGHTAPFNVLWMHLFATGKYEEANKIWEKYLSKSSRVMFQHICQEAKKSNDAVMCSNLLGLLVSSDSVTMGARGNVLSCLIDILTSNGKFDEALSSIQAAQRDVGLEYVNRTALQRLKTGLEEQGKVFPFTIPPKNASKAATTTTSSSDDD